MRLIVNADDFGMSIGVNYGIVHAHKYGIVTSTTMMVTTPGVNHAVKLSKENPKLGIGLHLNMTFGKPLTKCPSITKESGIFYKPKENPDQTKFLEEEIYFEFLAQYELFVKLMGKKPTHIDSHLYAHQKYNKARNAAIRLSNEKEIAIRDNENNYFEKTIFIDSYKYSNNDLKQVVISEINKMINNQSYELMVHPAFLDEFVINNSSYTIGRVKELEVLIDKDIQELIKNKNIKLINFLEIRRR